MRETASIGDRLTHFSWNAHSPRESHSSQFSDFCPSQRLLRMISLAMLRLSTLWRSVLRAGILVGLLPAAQAETPPHNLSLPDLEQRLTQIDSELSKLARCSLRSGVGAIGFRSMTREQDSGVTEWVQVAFDKAYPIDEIVLVPTLSRDSNTGFKSDGFPREFRVFAGTGKTTEGQLVAKYDSTDQLLPRIAPLTIAAQGRSASWIRIEVTQLSKRSFDQKFVFQLSELMVFSGERNIALRSEVKASSVHPQYLVHPWRRRFLVDGHMPYLMNTPQGSSSIAYIRAMSEDPALTLDLEEAFPLSVIHLHTVDQSDTVPQAYSGDLGLPKTLLIEGALNPDFSDGTVMLKVDLDEATEVGPIIMWPLKETNCRYVRIRCPNLETPSRFGFAEIELFSEGRNVALHKQAYHRESDLPSDEESLRDLSALTDGRNLYGEILPLRSWVQQLSRRHTLESERPLVAAALAQRYGQQKKNLSLMTWVAALLAAAVGFTILITRFLRLRQATQMRERFAADLHDELGANIHTIGLLGDLARETESPEERHELLERSRFFTERSGLAIRNWSKSLEARGLCEDLVEEMKRATDSLLADIDHDLNFEGIEFIKNLKPRRRIYTYLFYKECLVNILRHSHATHVASLLEASPKKLVLTITDNGHGIPNEVPPSLRRRARLLRGQVKAKNSPEGGTCIELYLRF